MNHRVLTVFFASFMGIQFFFYSPSVADEFPFDPPSNFTLSPKLIALHHPTTSQNSAAQLYFDQGLTFIYSFNHDAAYWSFLKASQEDPTMAMAYWGMALALGSNINMDITSERKKIAYDAIQKAIQESKKTTQNEQDYIKALSNRYSNDPHADEKKLAIAYSQAMRELSSTYPNDRDAATLFAESLLDVNPWKQWSIDGGTPLEGTLEAIEKLESVLKQDPNHLGANHYYIHAVEASQHPERALISAKRLEKLFTTSGHLLHMPSHIYLLVGDFHKAALANERAAAVDREYIRNYGTRGIYPIHYLSHNLYFLSRAYSSQGNFANAKQVADELVKLYLPHAHRMPELEYYAPTPLFVLLRFHQWKDILNFPPPPSNMKVFSILWHYSRALAFLSFGNISKAKEEQDLFLQKKARLPSNVNYGYNLAEKVLMVADLLLKAKLAEANQESAQSIDFYQRAVTEQDNLSYNEPPDWFFSVRENLGGALLRINHYEDAERVFRKDLERHPRNGRSLFGLKESLLAQSKTDDLYWIRQEFEQAWLYSDTQLTIEEL